MSTCVAYESTRPRDRRSTLRSFHGHTRFQPGIFSPDFPSSLLLTVITKLDTRLAELFDDMNLTHTEEDSHKDERNNHQWSNEQPQE